MSNNNSEAYISDYMTRARKAQQIFQQMSQETVDAAVKAIARVIYNNSETLAELAVNETGMGNVADKTLKNKNKSSMIWYSLKGKKSRGIINRDEQTGITKIGKPVGVVAAITPCTNPIVTPMSNAMFALKSGNAIIVTPHHRAVASSGKTVALMRNELVKLNLPQDLIQILSEQSREHTKRLISSADVVVATGGAGMVHVAYSSGRPALGVGAGNVQCIIGPDYDYKEAVTKIIAGRAFDHGIICSGEQTAICPDDCYENILKTFTSYGAYVARSDRERDAIRNAVFDAEGHLKNEAVGQSAQTVAGLAGITIPAHAKIIVVEAAGTGDKDFFGKEKMAPVLATYRYRTLDEAIRIAEANLEAQGKGHSVAIHSDNKKHIEQISEALCASRFVVNQVCSGSAGGSFTNGLAPTNTLGCGSWGHNSISENLSYQHLMNISRIAYHMPGNHTPTEEELWS